MIPKLLLTVQASASSFTSRTWPHASLSLLAVRPLGSACRQSKRAQPRDKATTVATLGRRPQQQSAAGSTRPAIQIGTRGFAHTTVAEAPALTNRQHAPSAGRPPLPPTRSRPCAAILALSGTAPWRGRDPGCCHRSAADGRTSAGDAFGACAQPQSPGNRCGCRGQNPNVIITQVGASTPPPPSPFTEETADATAAAVAQQPQPPHGRQPSRRAGWPSEGPRRLRGDGTCAPAPTRLRR